jgi:nucleoside-triphosphatase
VGFELCTFDDSTGLLAHVDFRSRFRVGRYGVDINPLEELGIRAIVKGIERGSLIIIDEIGRMELYSTRFQEIVLRALDADARLLATVGPQPLPFLQAVKSRVDCETLQLTEVNRDRIAADIVSRLSPI